jgi:hypothetical protein
VAVLKMGSDTLARPISHMVNIWHACHKISHVDNCYGSSGAGC